MPNQSICINCLNCKVSAKFPDKVFCDEDVWDGFLSAEHPFVTLDRQCAMFEDMDTDVYLDNIE